MRRWLVSFSVLALAAALASVLARVPEALSRIEEFRITEIRLEGNRFLSLEEASKTVAISPIASVWDDFGPLEEKLRGHPLVEDVDARRRFPGTLVLDVVEREPVGLVPNPTLEPVDASGRFLPIDPAEHRLDLPIIGMEGTRGDGTLSAAERRLVAEEIDLLAQRDPELLARISEIALDSRGDLSAKVWRLGPEGETWDLPVTIRFRPRLQSRRVRDGLRVLNDAMTHFEGAVVLDLDLRYEDQVVVRLNPARGN